MLPSLDDFVKPLLDSVRLDEGGHTLSKSVITRGDPSQSGHHFDWCFVFAMPDYAKQLSALRQHPKYCNVDEAAFNAEIAKAAELEEAEEKSFRKRLIRHMKFKHEVHVDAEAPFSSDLVERFMNDFVVEDNIKVPCHNRSVTSLSDIRRLCIDMFVNAFGQESEPYHIVLFASVDRDEIFLCVKMLEAAAGQHAQRSRYRVQLDPAAVSSDEFLGIVIDPGPEGPNGPAMQPAYVPHSEKIEPLLRSYVSEENKNVQSKYRKADHIRLLYDRVTDLLEIDGLKQWGLLKDMFPLHSHEKVGSILKQWSGLKRWYRCDQPINDIRDYYGESVALHFVFASHTIQWMRWLVLATVAVMIIDISVVMHTKGSSEFTKPIELLGVLGGDPGLPGLRVALAAFTVVWCQLFVVSLRRKAYRYNNLWGSDVDFSSSVKRELNPSFRSMTYLMPSDVDKTMKQHDVLLKTKQMGRALSLAGSAAFILLAFICMGVTLRIQANFAGRHFHLWSTLVSYGLTIEIKLFNSLWRKVCNVLTKHEYLRESNDYYASRACKTYFVGFISTFCTFYYIAFVMKPWGDSSYTTYETPYRYLTFQMITTFGLYALFAYYDALEPMVSFRASTRDELKRLKQRGEVSEDATVLEYSFLELQAKMSIYDGDDQNEDYMQYLLPLGFVLFFGMSLPLSAPVALVIFGIQLRVDAWKLTAAMRRPYPRHLRPHQWVWGSIVYHFFHVAAITNIGLICFAIRPLMTWDLQAKVNVFFSLMFVYAVFVHVIAYLVPEETFEIDLARRRHQRQRDLADQFCKRSTGTDRGRGWSAMSAEALDLGNSPGIDYTNICGLDAKTGGEMFRHVAWMDERL
eukprot:TRINITY_DN26820_c1_g1_i2.p1 TRINITY_DN26820_c1_g1~~TRINITY_DN26820_c1_g1_i2.p1  ORF type:complete len:855 (+),score=99.45 TRINITY_DN26820_c1_g1_i2:129-2693(+)